MKRRRSDSVHLYERVAFSYLLSRLRDPACAGMHATRLSFFGPLYGPSKGQHTLYRLFDGAAICFLLLPVKDKDRTASVAQLLWHAWRESGVQIV